MKHRIQIAIAALLLAGLATGCAPVPPRCTSEDGQHKWGKWEPTGRSQHAVYGISDVQTENQRTCETCGWTERSMGE